MAKYKKVENSGRTSSTGQERTGTTSGGVSKSSTSKLDGNVSRSAEADAAIQNKAQARTETSGGGLQKPTATGKNVSSTVARAVNAMTGITEGYTPTGNWNDAGLRGMGNGIIDPITQYKMQYEAAKARGDEANMKAAHDAAEAYRAQFGYSGGDDGSENIGVTPTVLEQAQQIQQQAPQWEMPAEYQYTPFDQTDLGKYARSEYQGMFDDLKSYPDFAYDPFTDPLYQQYAEAYTRGGQRAMQDTMGQLAARTGGLASSYAGQMAQQTYDAYMADLANKIPELRQIAYNMYADDYSRQLGLYDRGYQRYSDDFNRYMDSERFNYGLYDDRTRLGYDLWRAQVGDQQWQQQFDWTKSTDARDYARNVLTGDRDYEANRADTKWSQDFSQAQFDYQKEQAERDVQNQRIEQLISLVQSGYIPTAADLAGTGLTLDQLKSLADLGTFSRQQMSKYY